MPSEQTVINIISPKTGELELYSVLSWLYIIGFTILSLRFTINLISLLRKIKMLPTVPYHEATIVLKELKTAPYCFYKYIYVNKSDYENGMINKELLNHELAHLRQFHSIDLIIIELIQIVFWFNPLLIVYKSAIKTNHEYLADSEVIKNLTVRKDYFETLISFTFRNSSINLASGFNYSLIKKRLKMMTKNSSNAVAVSKVLLLVPMMTMLIVSLASCQTSSKDKKEPSYEMIFSYFSSKETFTVDNLMISRDLQFEINGVSVNASLISINQKTREFQTFVKGKLFQNKVEITCPKDLLTSGFVKYSSDKVDVKGDIIKLAGNAKIEAENNWIKANEIVISLN